MKKQISLVSSLAILTLILFSFQNCGNVEFAENPSLTSSLGTSIPTEADLISDSISLKTETLVLGTKPKEVDTSPMLFKVILDMTKSNLDYLNNISRGLENMVHQLEGKNFKIEVYTIGTWSAHPLLKYRERVVGIVDNDSMKRYKKYIEKRPKNPLAVLDSSKMGTDKNDFFKKISASINDLKSSKKLVKDTTPEYRCGLLHHLDQMKNEKDIKEKRLVFLLASDEDLSSRTPNCFKTRVITQTNHYDGRVTLPALQYIRISLKKRIPLDGKKYGWQESSIKVNQDDIKKCTKSEIDSYIRKNTSLAHSSRTYSSCRIEKKGAQNIRKFVSSDRHEVTTPYIGKEGNFKKQLELMIPSFNKNNLFFGSFTIQKSSEIRNEDQEIGARHLALSKIFSTEKNRKSYSITKRDYSDFVKDVVDFEEETASSSFVVPEQSSVAKSKNVHRVRVLEYDGVKMNELVKFTYRNKKLTLLDSRFNLNLGAKLEVLYSE